MWLRVIAVRICCEVGVVNQLGELLLGGFTFVIWMVSELFYKQFAHEDLLLYL